MKEIKQYPKVSVSSNEYRLYELTPEESALVEGKKYLLNRPYRMAYFNEHWEECLTQAWSESEYTYFIGFCDTVREADLLFKCCALELQVQQYQHHTQELIHLCGGPAVSIWDLD